MREMDAHSAHPCKIFHAIYRASIVRTEFCANIRENAIAFYYKGEQAAFTGAAAPTDERL